MAHIWQVLPNYFRDMAAHGQDTVYAPVFTPPLDGVKRPSQLLRVKPLAIGAYEFEAPTPTPTPTGTSTLTPTPTPTVTPTFTPTVTQTATPTARATVSPAEAIQAIQAAIQDYIADGKIHPQAEKGLMSKLDAALESLSHDNPQAAINQLGAFISYVKAQRGKMISEHAAVDLISQAQAVIRQLKASTPNPPRRLFSLTSVCRLAVDTGQLRVRNVSSAPQAFQLWRTDGGFLFEEIAPTGDSLWPVPWIRASDTFRLEIAGHEFTKAIGKKPLCTP